MSFTRQAFLFVSFAPLFALFSPPFLLIPSQTNFSSFRSRFTPIFWNHFRAGFYLRQAFPATEQLFPTFSLIYTLSEKNSPGVFPSLPKQCCLSPLPFNQTSATWVHIGDLKIGTMIPPHRFLSRSLRSPQKVKVEYFFPSFSPPYIPNRPERLLSRG